MSYIKKWVDEERKSEAEKREQVKKTRGGKGKAMAQVLPSLEQYQPYQRSSPKCQKIDSTLVEMVALDMQPVFIVEDLGFLKLLRTLDPWYQPPSRKTLSHSIIPQKYEGIKRKLLGELEKLKYCALTTDIWTSRQTMGYITITCHYIDSSWSLHSVILTTTNMQKDHTAEIIADVLKAATDEWGITQKIVAVVTDNASNIVAAIRLNGWKHVPCFAHTLNLIVQDALKDDPVLSNVWGITQKIVAVVTDNASNIVAAIRLNGWKHVPCFAHTLNLIVQDALKDDPVLSNVSKKCRDIVTYFHHSCKAAKRLREIQIRLGLTCHKLINDVQTRWNSTFSCLNELLSKMRLSLLHFVY